jgi:hypothetical protein
MAIIKMITPVDEIRGTIGGVTFSANKAGPYVKRWAKPIDARRPKQVFQRSLLSYLLMYWRVNLDQAQRDAWDVCAADPPEEDKNSLGVVYYLTGLEWFLRCNIRNYRAAGTFVDTAPGNTPVVPPAHFAFLVNDWPIGGQFALMVNQLDDMVDCYAVLHVAATRSATRLTPETGYKEVYIGDTGGVWNVDIIAGITDQFPWPQVGQKLFGKMYRQSLDGVRSTPLTYAWEVV